MLYISFFIYSQKIAKSNNIKVSGRKKSKGPKQRIAKFG
jgi:hypothetical protein